MNNWIDTLKKLSSESSAVEESKVLVTLPHDFHNDWDNFMRGKTCPILDNGDHGVYGWDLSQFLSKFNDQ